MNEYPQQILRVVSNETAGGGDDGPEYRIHYVLEELPRNKGWHHRYALVEEDGKGMGTYIAYGDNQRAMVRLTLRLGEFREWAPGVA